MPSAELCPGICNARYRKEHAIYQNAMAKHADLIANLPAGHPAPEPPQPPETQPVFGDPSWCSRCRAIIRQELADLDELAAHLAVIPPGIRPAVEGPFEDVQF